MYIYIYRPDTCSVLISVAHQCGYIYLYISYNKSVDLNGVPGMYFSF